MQIAHLEVTCPNCETAMTKITPLKRSEDFFSINCPKCGKSLNMRITKIEYT